MTEPLMILVAGPYRSGTGGDPALIQANVDAMTRAALEVHRRGHLPVMGEWFALPLIEAAEADGEADAYERLFHPIAEQVLARCDACLRIGGQSQRRGTRQRYCPAQVLDPEPACALHEFHLVRDQMQQESPL